jgi:hypothetical protein
VRLKFDGLGDAFVRIDYIHVDTAAPWSALIVARHSRGLVVVYSALLGGSSSCTQHRSGARHRALSIARGLVVVHLPSSILSASTTTASTPHLIKLSFSMSIVDSCFYFCHTRYSGATHMQDINTGSPRRLWSTASTTLSPCRLRPAAPSTSLRRVGSGPPC